MKEHFLVRAMNHYSMDWESPFSKHIYETEVTSVRLNMVYLHMWLLKFHMNRNLKPDKDFLGEEINKDDHYEARSNIQ